MYEEMLRDQMTAAQQTADADPLDLAADLERMEGLPSSAPQLGLTMRLYGGAPRTPCLLTTFSL